jgi:serine/threonine protein kinase
MQPAIPPGIILQNRYRLTKTLGQGGFGRTYLAEDTARFQELCVIKEFIPLEQGTYALQKSKELFKREAEVLYQIQHPQIPQFRAAFEQGKRLFFVQDYVEGKTYANLLDERIQQGSTFSEGEVVEFMQQMLSILEHIHSKGIIHRDIAPDNIILRDRDRLPVLIDFGIVKQGVAKLQSPDVLAQTAVGKLGYAPNEQLQTGQVSPTSDLYALAVTAVVLMTGRKPESLLDESTMTWRWHQWLPRISPWFAKFLNRMLSLRPNNRYQSATDAAQALRSLAGLVATPTSPTLINTGEQQPPTTVQKQQVNRRPQQPRMNVYRVATTPIWNSPWTLVIVVLGIFSLLTFGPVVLIGSMFPPTGMQLRRLKTPTPVLTSTTTKVITTPIPASTLSPSPNLELVGQSESLTLVVGQTNSKQGNLKVNQSITYIIPVEQGQQLNASVTKGGVVMSVLAPNKELVNFQAKLVPQWQGILPVTGDYYIKVTPADGVAETDYTVDISLASPVQPTPSTIPVQTSSSTPTISP